MADGNPISYSDIFDFSNDSDVKSAIDYINKLNTAYSDFNQVVISSQLDKLNTQQQAAADSAQKLADSATSLSVTFKENQAALITILSSLEDLVKKQNEDNESKKKTKETNDLVNNSVNQLSDSLKKLVIEYKNTDAVAMPQKMKDLAAQIVATKSQIQSLTDATKVTTTQFKAAAGSYLELDSQTKNLIKDLKQMEGGMDANNKKASELKQQIFENTQRLKEYDAQIGQSFRNVGNYQSAFDGVKSSIVGVTAGLLALVGLSLSFKDAFDVATKFDSATKTLDALSGNTDRAGKNFSFLEDTANKLGLEFNALEIDFNKFYATSKLAGLSLDETQSIFKDTSTAISGLHLNTEQASAIFDSFQRIMAKGTVSATDLKRQLGENLPGAFELAAKSIGVTTGQLTDMLKKGELISTDFLPKFAKTIAETYGSGTETTISLQASTNRLKNAFDSFFENNKVVEFFSSFVDAGTSVLIFLKGLLTPSVELSTKAYKDNSDELDKLTTNISPLLEKYDTLKGKTTLTKDEHIILKDTIKGIGDLLPGAVTQFDQYGNALDINRGKVNEFITAQQKLNDTYKKTAVNDLQNDLKSNLAAGQKATQNLNQGFILGNSGERGSDNLARDPTTDKTGVLTVTGKQQKKIIDDSQQKIFDDAKQLAELGIAADNQTKDFIGGVNAQRLERLNQIAKLSQDIQTKSDEAGDALLKKDYTTQKALQVQITELKKEREQLINPGDAVNTVVAGSTNTTANDNAIRDKANKLAEASANLLIAQATQEYNIGAKSTQDQIDFENKKLEILTTSYSARLKLYNKDDEQYKAIQASQIKATDDAQNKILSIKDSSLQQDIKTKLAQAQLDYSNTKQTIQDQENYELKKEQIQIDGLEKRKALYNKESDQYKALQEQELQIEAAYGIKHESLEKEQAKKTYEQIKKEQEDLSSQRSDQINRAVDYNNLQAAGGGISKQDAAAKNHEIVVDYYQSEIKIQQDALSKMTEADEGYFDKKKQLAALEKNLEKENGQFAIKTAQDVKAAKEKLIQAQYDFERQIATDAFALVSEISDAKVQGLQDQMSKEEALAGNNAEAKAKIDEKYQKKIAEQKRKQAIFDKLSALFSIGIDTAKAVAKATAEFPETLGQPFVTYAIIQGVAEAALVLAKPLPSYAKGRPGGGAEFAELNEQGAELIEDKGRFRISNEGKRGIGFLKAGEKVYTAQATKEKFKEITDKNMSDSFMDSLLLGTGVIRQKDENIIDAIVKSKTSSSDLTLSFRQAIKDIQIEQHIYSEKGYQNFLISRNARISRINNRNTTGGNG